MTYNDPPGMNEMAEAREAGEPVPEYMFHPTAEHFFRQAMAELPYVSASTMTGTDHLLMAIVWLLAAQFQQARTPDTDCSLGEDEDSSPDRE